MIYERDVLPRYVRYVGTGPVFGLRPVGVVLAANNQCPVRRDLSVGNVG